MADQSIAVKPISKSRKRNERKKLRKLHVHACATHSIARAEERMGIVLGRDEVAVMSELIALGQGVRVGGSHYLLRYGKHIFHVVYCTKLRAIKTIYPDNKVPGLVIGTVPREELKKLIETR